LRLAACGLRLAACGLRLAACGLRLAACGLRLAACGLRLAGPRVIGDRRPLSLRWLGGHAGFGFVCAVPKEFPRTRVGR
ncbi:MAG: hypothetical protein GC165_20745, partial [Armatimonadetes bacterium]|nr:hypothetical protein [Armatimonadota bacterium]